MSKDYIKAMVGALKGKEDPQLLSLAFVDSALPGFEPAERKQLLKLYTQSPSGYTACHDVAAKVADLLGTGKATVKSGAKGVAAAIEAMTTTGFVIQIKYGDHSIVLVSHSKGVESIEGWAGSDPGEGGVTVFPLYKCLTKRADEIELTAESAAGHLANVLNKDKKVRGAAWDGISRAGLYGFESGKGVRDIDVTIRKLDTTGNVTKKLRQKIDAAKVWMAELD